MSSIFLELRVVQKKFSDKPHFKNWIYKLFPGSLVFIQPLIQATSFSKKSENWVRKFQQIYFLRKTYLKIQALSGINYHKLIILSLFTVNPTPAKMKFCIILSFALMALQTSAQSVIPCDANVYLLWPLLRPVATISGQCYLQNPNQICLNDVTLLPLPAIPAVAITQACPTDTPICCIAKLQWLALTL